MSLKTLQKKERKRKEKHLSGSVTVNTLILKDKFNENISEIDICLNKLPHYHASSRIDGINGLKNIFLKFYNNNQFQNTHFHKIFDSVLSKLVDEDGNVRSATISFIKAVFTTLSSSSSSKSYNISCSNSTSSSTSSYSSLLRPLFRRLRFSLLSSLSHSSSALSSSSFSLLHFILLNYSDVFLEDFDSSNNNNISGIYLKGLFF
jgi:hypothetical protein